MLIRASILALCIAAVAAPAVAQTYYHGPGGDGIAPGQGENAHVKQHLRYGGYASDWQWRNAQLREQQQGASARTAPAARARPAPAAPAAPATDDHKTAQAAQPQSTVTTEGAHDQSK